MVPHVPLEKTKDNFAKQGGTLPCQGNSSTNASNAGGTKQWVSPNVLHNLVYEQPRSECALIPSRGRDTHPAESPVGERASFIPSTLNLGLGHKIASNTASKAALVATLAGVPLPPPRCLSMVGEEFLSNPSFHHKIR